MTHQEKQRFPNFFQEKEVNRLLRETVNTQKLLRCLVLKVTFWYLNHGFEGLNKESEISTYPSLLNYKWRSRSTLHFVELTREITFPAWICNHSFPTWQSPNLELCINRSSKSQEYLWETNCSPKPAERKCSISLIWQSTQVTSRGKKEEYYIKTLWGFFSYNYFQSWFLLRVMSMGEGSILSPS